MTDIIIRDLYKRFGEKEVLRGFSLTLPAGQCVGLMGESGCGKTTLLRILLGLLKPDGGEVTGLPPRISVVFQEERLCDGFSALTNVAIAARPGTPRSAVVTCLQELGLGEAMLLPVNELSGGMRRRVAIARALLAEGDLLLLDEPFKGLDEETRRTVMAVVQRMAAGKTILLVTHDEAEIRAFGAPLCRMSGGKQVGTEG